ncbi:MAG: hypothetical protein ACJ71G_18195 [Nitrososphaeraceae archaeon]
MDSNTYHIKMAVLEELRHTLKVKRINDELLEHLASTLRWLLRYAETNNITLPEKDKIVLALDRAMEIAEKLPPTKLQQPEKTPDEDNTTRFLVGFSSRIFQGCPFQC